MKVVKLILLFITTLFTLNVFGASKKLLIEGSHPNDKKTVIRIWKTSENKYIIRSSYSDDEDDFDQSVLYQWHKVVEYNGFAKIVTFKTPGDQLFIITYENGQFSFVYGFFSNTLNTTISKTYDINYIDKDCFNNL